MNKQELIKKYKEYEDGLFDIGARVACQLFLKELKQLDEPQKVKVPQCVADWISFVKTNGLKFKNTYGFYEEIAPSDDVYRVMYYIFKESIAGKEIRKWVGDNIDTFARAWLDGYEVEKEKRYLVKIKGDIKENTLVYGELLERYFFTKGFTLGNAIYYHTRKELEEAGFGWVFDCPGIEIEEIEEMIQTLEEGMKNQSKRIKIPREIRPFDVGYRIVNKHGQALALKNGASIFALPSLAEKAIKKEFGKNDPDFDIEKHFVEEVAIVNLSKFHSYFEEAE